MAKNHVCGDITFLVGIYVVVYILQEKYIASYKKLAV